MIRDSGLLFWGPPCIADACGWYQNTTQHLLVALSAHSPFVNRTTASSRKHCNDRSSATQHAGRRAQSASFHRQIGVDHTLNRGNMPPSTFWELEGTTYFWVPLLPVSIQFSLFQATKIHTKDTQRQTEIHWNTENRTRHSINTVLSSANDWVAAQRHNAIMYSGSIKQQ